MPVWVSEYIYQIYYKIIKQLNRCLAHKMAKRREKKRLFDIVLKMIIIY